MALNNADILKLRAEINIDPMGLGYAGLKDEPTADLLNEPGASGEKVPNKAVQVSNIMDAIVANELSNVPLNELQFFLVRIQTAGGSIDISDGGPFLTQISQTFSVVNTPSTRAALLLLRTRDASRAEVLFGDSITVSYMDVGTARLVI